MVVNKIDRPAARPDWVVDSTFELFMDLGATDEQCDFPVVYASGVNGVAGNSPDTVAEDLQPLFEAIIKNVSVALSRALSRIFLFKLFVVPKNSVDVFVKFECHR